MNVYITYNELTGAYSVRACGNGARALLSTDTAKAAKAAARRRRWTVCGAIAYEVA